MALAGTLAVRPANSDTVSVTITTVSTISVIMSVLRGAVVVWGIEVLL